MGNMYDNTLVHEAVIHPGNQTNNGTQLRFEANKYNNELYVSIRYWSKRPGSNQWLPTKKGINIKAADLKQAAVQLHLLQKAGKL